MLAREHSPQSCQRIDHLPHAHGLTNGTQARIGECIPTLTPLLSAIETTTATERTLVSALAHFARRLATCQRQFVGMHE